MSDTKESTHFAAVVAMFAASDPSVERVKLFGYDCLRADGKVFTKVDKGRIIIRLPPARIDALMAAGRLVPYERGLRTMKQWAAIEHADTPLVLELAREARSLVKT
ncbi:MAG: hypothetical protein KGL44_06140 [Sphingomonadales bacterium]|nr:hypothetical protein [Sphingomonadales bacterium]